MRLMAIDGNSLLNRAFYGVRLLSNSEGVYTNAVLGFLNMYFKLLEDFSPDHICVCFDVRAKTFRHERFDGYKAQRKPMPEELAQQMPLIKQALDLLGVPRMELEGFEADDLLGTLAAECRANNDECVIVTGDKDSLQFAELGAKVALIVSKMGQTSTKVYDIEVFKEDYCGLTPARLVDLKAIMGDSSDNIPGVPGIGEKGATDLICRFGSLEGVYENINDSSITAGMRKKLEAGRDSAFMSYELAKGVTDAPLPCEYSQIKPTLRKDGELYAFLARLELKSIIKKLDVKAERQGEQQGADFKARGFEYTEQLERLGEVSAVYTDFGAMLMAATTQDKCYVCPISEKNILQIGSFFAHEAKSIIRELALHKLPKLTCSFDTALAAYLLNPTASGYELDTCARTFFDLELPQMPEKQLSMMEDDSSDLHSALALRSQLIFALHGCLEPKIESEGMGALMRDIELPLLEVLADIELCGMAVDRERLLAFGEQLSSEISTLERDIHTLAGVEFNIGSPKQLSVVLFETMGLKTAKKTKNGYSTDNEVLEKLKSVHPVIEKIILYRQLTKLRGTYVEGLVKVIGRDGRIHTTLNQMVTATGRLSSTEPNLQNIPIRREEGAEIRKCFVPREGCTLVDADYSQIELRLLAHISGDIAMIAAFNSGEDIHTVTASQVFKVPPQEVTAEQRRRAKAVNFGIVYGISAFSLADDIGVFTSEAQEYINAYFEKYTGVHSYMKRVQEQAGQDGYVQSLYGRRRYLPELSSSNHNIRSFGQRAALNTPIQGTAADIMKIAMIRVHDALRREGLEARLIMQVHDELIVECPHAELDSVSSLLKREMEGAASLLMPLTADTKHGDNWYDAH